MTPRPTGTASRGRRRRSRGRGKRREAGFLGEEPVLPVVRAPPTSRRLPRQHLVERGFERIACITGPREHRLVHLVAASATAPSSPGKAATRTSRCASPTSGELGGQVVDQSILDTQVSSVHVQWPRDRRCAEEPGGGLLVSEDAGVADFDCAVGEPGAFDRHRSRPTEAPRRRATAEALSGIRATRKLARFTAEPR